MIICQKNQKYKIQSRREDNTHYVLQNENGIHWSDNGDGNKEAFRFVDAGYKA